MSCAVGVSSFSPAAVSQAPQEAANSALASERADEAVERAGAVPHAVEAPISLIASRVPPGLVDRADADCAAVDLCDRRWRRLPGGA
jgi:hypothetical protein